MIQQTGQSKSRRHPIVTVLGHIDHGKTTLLDYIRKSNVAGKESGGITQHIGAYEVEIKTKSQGTKIITFIDTPGHEVFSQMRSRGAKIADVALLVVAADDGVKPQTEEAISAIREAKIPFVVALNKIDKDTVDIERVKKELGDKEIYLEEWGGKTPLVKVSAKTGEGVEELLEMILLVSELEELGADFTKRASGVVIESELDPKRGNAATLLLRDGVLKKGDWVLAGNASVKTKILENLSGEPLEEARASSPVRVVGFDKVPQVGSTFTAFESRENMEKAQSEVVKERPSLRPVLEEGKSNVPLVLKADVAGSLEALSNEIKKFENEEVLLVILRAGVGNIGEGDIKLASSGKAALVVGFRVKIEKGVSELAERFGVTVKIFEIIYELAEWLRKEIEKRLPEKKERKVLGRVKIVKIFKQTESKQVVGGKVISGGIFDKKRFTLLRRDFPLSEGKILELQQQKLKASEVLERDEFGAMVEVENSVVPGDVLEIFEEEIKKVGLKF